MPYLIVTQTEILRVLRREFNAPKGELNHIDTPNGYVQFTFEHDKRRKGYRKR
jgi:hypothetical protein